MTRTLRATLQAVPTQIHAFANEALDRTVLLMRDHISTDVGRDELVAALLRPRVQVVADKRNLSTNGGQTALISTVLLLLRSGAEVSLAIANVPILGVQPPLTGHRLLPSIIEAGQDVLGDARCTAEPIALPDIVVLIGDTAWRDARNMVIRVFGSSFDGAISVASNAHAMGRAWRDVSSPFGPVAAGALAAGEVYKWVMRSLRKHASTPIFDELFAVAAYAEHTFNLSDDTLTSAADLGAVDVISGGAIAQAALFVLARVPGAKGRIRVVEPEASDVTNLNRYALLLRSRLGEPKAVTLASLDLGGIDVEPVVARFDDSTRDDIGTLAPKVLVGVDHIPTRWAVQRADPQWLGIGATSHYSAMSSEHVKGLPCAWCLHPTDADDDRPIPTVAFVSQWAGLLVSSRLVKYCARRDVPRNDQYDFFTSLRPDLPGSIWRSPVAARTDCPNRCID